MARIKEKSSRAKPREPAAIEREAKQMADELMNSRHLKVFRYVPKRKRIPHLYAETSNGTQFPLRGKPVDESVGASQIESVSGDECLMCKRSAERIFQRKAH